jgi:hypothetical protein
MGLLAGVVLVYLVIALTYSLLTPALEPNDEPSHLAYVEYVLQHHHLPAIPAENNATIEWHQPPAYYIAVAGWQKILGLKPIPPLFTPWHPNGPIFFNHDYKGAELHDALTLHLLRLVSIAWGLVVVICSLAAAWLVSRRRDITIAVGLAVALWPKLLVLDSSLTNDAMADAVCAAALVAVLLWYERGQTRWAVVFGLLAGLGALTKYTTLPVIGLLGAGLLIAAFRRRQWQAVAAPPVVFVITTGWWWIRDTVVFGDPFASSVSRRYMQSLAPWLIRHHHSNPTVLAMIPSQLAGSVFYQAGENQVMFPHTWGLWLDLAAILSIAIALVLGRHLHWTIQAAAIGSFLAWLLIAEQTTLAEGRYVLVGAIALAYLAVLGTAPLRKLGLATWPLLLVAANVWVFASYLVPYGRL